MTDNTNLISDDKVVSIAYTMRVDGDDVENAAADDPLVYLHGAENIIPGLEKALTGKKVGDKFTVEIAPEDAFGDYDPDDIEEFDLDEFGGDDIAPGTEIELVDDTGLAIEATIKEIDGDVVLVDLNPPYAGKTVTFEVEVLSVRDADESERDHGHPHELDGEGDHE